MSKSPAKALAWKAADPKLSTILSNDKTISDGFGGVVEVKRKGLVKHAGCYELNDAYVASLIPKPVLLADDPYSRKAVCLTHWRRPMFTASMGKVFRAWPKALRASLSTESFEVDDIMVLGGFYSHSNNYFHYWVDVMADLWFLRQSFGDVTAPQLLLPFEGLKWQEGILELCGIPKERVIPLSDVTALRAKRLRVAVRARGGHVNPPWLVRALREVSGFGPPIQPPRRSIYLSRLGAKRRPLKNEAEVIQALEQRGFEIIDAGLLSVAEQQILFSEAALIVASHGAALTNLAWCNSSAHVIEFLPDRHGNPCFSDFAEILGMGYQAIVCKQDAGAENVIEAGFEVPLNQLLRRVDELSSQM